MKHDLNRITFLILIVFSLLLGGCGFDFNTQPEDHEPSAPSGQMTDLMDGISAQALTIDVDLLGAGRTAAADAAVRLLAGLTQDDEENVMISPLSLLTALGMTLNGAQGETRAEMERALGFTCQQLNDYLYAYRLSLVNDDGASLQSANSIWLKQDPDLTVSPDFLQTVADYYAADVRSASFDDGTVKQINQWVSDHTHGMIPSILDKIDDDARFYLINAVAFEAKWAEPYRRDEESEAVFHGSHGDQTVTMMAGEERVYLVDDNAVGFVKDYRGGNYRFAVLLPAEGVDVRDYAAALTGERLISILDHSISAHVVTRMPKFTASTSVSLKDTLQQLGIEQLFSPDRCDLSALGSLNGGRLYVSDVLHKTTITVDEAGTKAGAATVVEGMGTTAVQETFIVTLDRPFVYMILDAQTSLPVFLGILENVVQD